MYVQPTDLSQAVHNIVKKWAILAKHATIYSAATGVRFNHGEHQKILSELKHKQIADSSS